MDPHAEISPCVVGVFHALWANNAKIRSDKYILYVLYCDMYIRGDISKDRFPKLNGIERIQIEAGRCQLSKGLESSLQLRQNHRSHSTNAGENCVKLSI